MGRRQPHSGNNRSDAAGGGHAHCGAMIYLGRFAGKISIKCSWATSWPPHQHGLRGQGLGLRGPHGADFLPAHDAWARFINLQYGPDGNVFLIDWYDENACHHRDTNGHDRTNGRVFKISYQNARPATVDLQKLSDDALAELQLEANDWYVRHARRILQEHGAGDAVRRKLVSMAFEHPEETRHLRALWALHVTGGLDETLAVRVGLENDQPHVRAWTIQLLTEDPHRPCRRRCSAIRGANQRRSFASRATVPGIGHRADAGRPPRADFSAGLLAQAGDDAADHNLPLMLWYAAEPLAEYEPAQALRWPTMAGFRVCCRT